MAKNSFKMLSSDVRYLLEIMHEEKTISALKELAEELEFSDPVSDEKLVQLDTTIKENIALMLEEPTCEENMCEFAVQTLAVLKDRNRKCKLVK